MTDPWGVRYERQIMLPQIGKTGQQKLGKSSVLIVGCGGLGGIIGSLVVRAGVGTVRIAESDTVELGNLHRQLLYLEEDVRDGRSKAEAAGRILTAANSEVKIEAIRVNVTDESIDELLNGIHVLVDGTDNLRTRHVINRACVEKNIPWVFGGVSGTQGMVMLVVPGVGPCFCCLFPGIPESFPSKPLPILNTVPTLIGAMQVTEAFKLLVGAETIPGRLLEVDLWTGEFQHVTIPRDPNCPVCSRRTRD